MESDPRISRTPVKISDERQIESLSLLPFGFEIEVDVPVIVWLAENVQAD